MYAAEAFAGGGLLSLALAIEGIHVGEVCEINKAAVETLKANFDPKIRVCNARNWFPKNPKGGIDLLCGGPPCQPWSGAGARRGQRDPRDMFPEIIRWTKETHPKLIVMENVGSTPETRARARKGLSGGILDGKHQGYLDWWWGEMNKAGYEGVVWSVLAADYGTPQLRPRVMFVAWPRGSGLASAMSQPPPITHTHPDDAEKLGLLPWTSGLERLVQGCCGGFGYYSCQFLNNNDGACESCHQGSNYAEAMDEFTVDPELSREQLEYVMRDPRRIHKHRPADMSGTHHKGAKSWVAPTMVADLARGVPYGLVIDIGGLVSDFSDPEDYKALRRLTPREAAKLQDVPQWFELRGSTAQRYKQVGNGIPINLGRAIARHVLRAFGPPEELLPAERPHTGLWPLTEAWSRTHGAACAARTSAPAEEIHTEQSKMTTDWYRKGAEDYRTKGALQIYGGASRDDFAEYRRGYDDAAAAGASPAPAPTRRRKRSPTPRPSPVEPEDEVGEDEGPEPGSGPMTDEEREARDRNTRRAMAKTAAEGPWHTGPLDRSEGCQYVHLIRGPDDPERSPRSARQGDTTAWKRKTRATPENIVAWKERIVDLLTDGHPRTFNAITVTIADITADIGFDGAPDMALWELVEEGRVEHTDTAPIQFRLVREATAGELEPGAAEWLEQQGMGFEAPGQAPPQEPVKGTIGGRKRKAVAPRPPRPPKPPRPAPPPPPPAKKPRQKKAPKPTPAPPPPAPRSPRGTVDFPDPKSLTDKQLEDELERLTVMIEKSKKADPKVEKAWDAVAEECRVRLGW